METSFINIEIEIEFNLTHNSKMFWDLRRGEIFRLATGYIHQTTKFVQRQVYISSDKTILHDCGIMYKLVGLGTLIGEKTQQSKYPKK